ncbi:MAG: cobyric acid synthase CobQ, partial [Spirochaetes bacterium]
MKRVKKLNDNNIEKPLQIMFLGTSSDAGKTIIAAGFCRILKNLGYRVCPFKAQNMALNSYVTMNGDEMGRSQALQAIACGILPSSDMNPVLIKPSSDMKSQIILQGKVLNNFTAQQYYENISTILPKVIESYNRLKKNYNAIVIEGAGSAAELNLKNRDIVNMSMARIAGAPAVLIADIDRGGVFASIYGTIKLLNKKERRHIIGIIINKFRGDISIFQEGINIIERITGKKVFGILPYSPDLNLPEEDSVALCKRVRGLPKPNAPLQIGVIRLPYISNYTDFDPLELEKDVSLTYIDIPQDIFGKNAIIIPGTKSTIMDLKWLRQNGFVESLTRYVENGGVIFGICGGFQMLGISVRDPYKIESSVEKEDGIGLLPITTILEKNKKLENIKAQIIQSTFNLISKEICKKFDKETITGYEIHMGKTEFQKKL